MIARILCIILISCSAGLAQEPPTKLQTNSQNPHKLTGLITFAFYKDVEAAEDFYVNTLGLKKSYHRPITRVFQVNEGAAIGLMDVSASPETKIVNNDMGFSFIVDDTKDVDRWYDYLKSKNVNIYATPSDGTRTPVQFIFMIKKATISKFLPGFPAPK